MDFRKVLKLTRLKKERLQEIEDFVGLGLIGPKIILAGGALRTIVDAKDDIQDFDLFLITENIVELKTLKTQVEGLIFKKGGEKIFQCPKDELRSYRCKGMKIQVISLDGRMYSSPEAVINSFDINASRLAYDGTILYVAPKALRDLRSRQISLHKIPFPLATAKRIARFGTKGFYSTEAFRELLEFVYNSGRDSVVIDLETKYVD